MDTVLSCQDFTSPGSSHISSSASLAQRLSRPPQLCTNLRFTWRASWTNQVCLIPSLFRCLCLISLRPPPHLHPTLLIFPHNVSLFLPKQLVIQPWFEHTYTSEKRSIFSSGVSEEVLNTQFLCSQLSRKQIQAQLALMDRTGPRQVRPTCARWGLEKLRNGTKWVAECQDRSP